MSKLSVITIEENEQYLRQISKEINPDDKDLKNNIADLEEYCKENQVLAMASVQIGIPKRLIYIKNTNLDIVNRKQSNTDTEEDNSYNEQRVLINPVIVSREGLTDYWEVCESCLDNFGHVRRPYKIVVEYNDKNWNKQSDVFEGFEATVLSHEMDHLDGILHMDIADELLIMAVEERKKFRQSHGYNIISKTGKYEELLKKFPIEYHLSA